jgi:WD40 repeat protein
LLAVDRAQNRGAWLLRQPDSEQPKRTDFTLPLSRPEGTWIDLSPDGRFLAVGGQEGLNVVSVDGSRQLYADSRMVSGVRFSPDGRWLFVASDGYEIWSTSTWKCEFVLNASFFLSSASQAAFHPKKRILATAFGLGRIGLWSTTDWYLLGVLESPGETPVAA